MGLMKGGAMPDYSRYWWYIERPFPWVGILACAVPILLIVFAVVLGINELAA